MATNEKIQFRLFQMPCCSFLCCWVNPRLPTHCPECGKHVLMQLRTGQYTRIQDDDAWLRINGYGLKTHEADGPKTKALEGKGN